ncbi:hypothetical protein AB0L13_40390 [Saccharopolyspora shandongensis]|uniref:hypothetical protein n=1 Tax=Saccharopolyspora shandongensis TaxID=418495 RepID=UPI003427F2A6
MIDWTTQNKDLLTVLIAALAFAVAACSAWYAWRQYRLAWQRERMQLAAKVAVWHDETGVPRYVNTSGLPIWSVSVEFDGHSEPAERGCWPPAPDPVDARDLLGADAEQLFRSALLDALDRQRKAREAGKPEEWTRLRFTSGGKPRAIVFTDGNSRRWRRDLEGILTQVKD